MGSQRPSAVPAAAVRGLLAALCGVAAALVLSGVAAARGGAYDIVGATPEQRAQIDAALAASSFDWGLVGRRVRIMVTPGVDSQAWPGAIQLDANLVDSGCFAWGIIQHEFAHQVDFLLLDDADRALLAPRLGGSAWWAPIGPRPVVHDDQTGERFADELAWAFWASRDNVIEPHGTAFTRASFRALLLRLLGGVGRALPQAGASGAAAAPPAALAAAPLLGVSLRPRLLREPVGLRSQE